MITIKEKFQNSKLKIATSHFDQNLKYNDKTDKILNIFYANDTLFNESKIYKFFKANL